MDDPSLAVERALSQPEVSPTLAIDQLSTLVHGSTLITNAIIERKGA
jgi:N-methylhydantoinase A/oxoprolinase/acetone carboxylase beta subunit